MNLEDSWSTPFWHEPPIGLPGYPPGWADALPGEWEAEEYNRPEPRHPAEGDYEAWLRAFFPQYIEHPFGAHHRAFWEWERSPESWVLSGDGRFCGWWPAIDGRSSTSGAGRISRGRRTRRT